MSTSCKRGPGDRRTSSTIQGSWRSPRSYPSGSAIATASRPYPLFIKVHDISIKVTVANVTMWSNRCGIRAQGRRLYHAVLFPCSPYHFLNRMSASDLISFSSSVNFSDRLRIPWSMGLDTMSRNSSTIFRRSSGYSFR